MGLPGVVEQGERPVLRHINAHRVGTETSVFLQSHAVLPSRDGSGTGTYRLEVGIRDPSCLFHGGKDRGAHAVTPCHVLGAPFGKEPAVLAYLVPERYSIVIVTSMRCGNQPDTWMQFPVEPQVVQAVLRNANDYGDLVVGADLCECACRVAGALHHQDAPFLA